MDGYLRLSRNILDWEWFDNSKMVHVWIYLLFKANFRDTKWHGVNIPRGSFKTSLQSISFDTGLTIRETRTCIQKLKSTGEITIKSTNKYSIITICKYGDYNIPSSASDKQSDNQIDKQATSKRQANDKQTTHLIEEEIEEREEYNYPPLPPQGGGVRPCACAREGDREAQQETEAMIKQIEEQNKIIEMLQAEKEGRKVAKKKTTNYPDDFESDFILYNRKGNKKLAFEEWKKLSDDDKVKMRRHIPSYVLSNDRQYLKDFERYIKHRVFESVVYDKASGQMLYDPDKYSATSKYRPSGMYVTVLGDGTYNYFGPYDGVYDVDIYDDYDDDNRPDGARISLNNRRGIATWHKAEKRWEVVR